MPAFQSVLGRNNGFAERNIEACIHCPFKGSKYAGTRCCPVKSDVEDGSRLVQVQRPYRKQHPCQVCCRCVRERACVTILNEVLRIRRGEGKVPFHPRCHHLDNDMGVCLPDDHPRLVGYHEVCPLVVIGLALSSSPERNKVSRSCCHLLQPPGHYFNLGFQVCDTPELATCRLPVKKPVHMGVNCFRRTEFAQAFSYRTDLLHPHVLYGGALRLPHPSVYQGPYSDRMISSLRESGPFHGLRPSSALP